MNWDKFKEKTSFTQKDIDVVVEAGKFAPDWLTEKLGLKATVAGKKAKPAPAVVDEEVVETPVPTRRNRRLN